MLNKMALGLMGLMALSSAQAAVISYSDRTTFESQGSIAFNNDFEHWNTSGGFAFPADPYTEQGVTYNSTNNLIVGINSPYTNQGNHITNNYWTPVTGELDNVDQFDMFAFDVGVYGDANLSLTLFSNLTSYLIDLVAPSANNSALDFLGFIVDGEGEFFTGFSLASAGSGHLPMMDNVTLGNVTPAAVPEPGTLALFALGLAGLGFTRRYTGA